VKIWNIENGGWLVISVPTRPSGRTECYMWSLVMPVKNDICNDKRSQLFEQLRVNHLMPLVNNILIFSRQTTWLHLQRLRPPKLTPRARQKRALVADCKVSTCNEFIVSGLWSRFRTVLSSFSACIVTEWFITWLKPTRKLNNVIQIVVLLKPYMIYCFKHASFFHCWRSARSLMRRYD
jgi:hypothetical protein